MNKEIYILPGQEDDLDYEESATWEYATDFEDFYEEDWDTYENS